MKKAAKNSDELAWMILQPREDGWMDLCGAMTWIWEIFFETG
jgi:hypothetical protein